LSPIRLGLIGGRRTVVSGIYRRKFAGVGIAVEQRVAQPLSALIERGELNSALVYSAARRILTPLRDCSHILLARTHYPAITAVLSQYVSPETTFVDPAAAVAEKISAWTIPSGGNAAIVTTGDAIQMAESAARAFGIEL